MRGFKEWLSDYLRYIILVIAALLAVGAIFLGIRLYQESGNPQQESQSQGDEDSVIIIDETESESGTESESETETEPESETETEPVTETERETEEGETEADSSEDGTATAQANGGSAGAAAPGTSANSGEETMIVVGETAAQDSESTQDQGTSAQTEEQVQIVETQAPETDPPETDPPEPVYLTMTGACYIRSYPDYGDNIIGEYPAGTVVEFVEDVGGWYHVRVDGLDGYMGARFFS